MNDDFRPLNRKRRRYSDRWLYRFQWLIASLIGISILITIFAQCWMRWGHHVR